jgi:opacity protein-like surface antigen
MVKRVLRELRAERPSSKGPVMRRLHLLLIATVLSSATAHGADMPGGAPLSIPLPTTAVKATGGWYARGDLAYGWYRMDSATTPSPFPSPAINDLGKGVSGGVGIGYKGNWLRTDVTLDYTGLTYTGTSLTAGDTSAKVRAVTALFNGYLDLGTWYCLTPYVGAGLGASNLKTSDYVSAAAPPFTPGLSNTQWKFAWALMAGSAINFTPNVALDVGYRYLNLGDVSTASDASGQTTLKNIAAHEVRVGVRWSFDGNPIVH